MGCSTWILIPQRDCFLPRYQNRFLPWWAESSPCGIHSCRRPIKQPFQLRNMWSARKGCLPFLKQTSQQVPHSTFPVLWLWHPGIALAECLCWRHNLQWHKIRTNEHSNWIQIQSRTDWVEVMYAPVILTRDFSEKLFFVQFSRVSLVKNAVCEAVRKCK